MMYLKIGLILTFAGYAALEGIREAYLYHAINTSQNPNGVNLHPLFAAQRLLFGALVLFISWDIIFCLSLALLFSAIHNGFYYHSRHKLNPAIYPKGWADESTTSTAFFEFSFLERVVLAEIGIVILALDFVFIN